MSEPSAAAPARLAAMEQEHADLEARLADADVAADPAELRRVTTRYRQLDPLVDAARRRRAVLADAEAARELLREATAEERPALEDELESATLALGAVDEELRALMVPPDPYAGRDVIVEIRGAEGGEEANLFARDLYDMYRAYAGRHGLKTDTLSLDASDLGGVNEVTFSVQGTGAWPRFKYEGGPHRVQRVPVTESQGRIHTSAATVLVLPEADEVEVAIDDKDLQIDVFRSSGPGGQSVNTTDSAVRITHVPTGIVVSMQDERSQLQNRQRAMLVLRARLLEAAERERNAERSVERRSQVGGGGRGEKIRTYNFKENRVTDHRIGFTIYRLADVLAGDLDDIVVALAADERARQLAEDAFVIVSGSTTWRRLLAETALAVGERPAARWLCEVASGADRIEDVLDEPVTQRTLAHLDDMVERFHRGEPLAYVLGRWSFRHLDLAVDRRVLIPRPETEVVAGVAIDLAAGLPRPIVVADLGTGSGAIGLALADELPVDGVTVWLTDASADALDVARANLAGVGRKGANVRIVEGSWFTALPSETLLDVAVANPPYIAEGSPSVDESVRSWEPHGALFAGPDGLADVREIVATAPGHVRAGGWLVLEIGADQGSTVERLLLDHDYRDVSIRPDLAGRDRVAVARSPAS